MRTSQAILGYGVKQGVNDPLLPWAAQGFRIATLTLERYFASRNFML
jgi:hypothetical protein